MLEQVVQANVLLHGGRVGFFGGDANKLVEDMKILQPTFFPAVPRVLNKIYDKAQAFINFQLRNNPQIKEKSLIERNIRKPFMDSLGGKVRCILSTAAPIHKSVLQFFTEVLGCELSVTGMESEDQTRSKLFSNSPKDLGGDLKQQSVYQDNHKGASSGLSLKIELAIPFTRNQNPQDIPQPLHLGEVVHYHPSE
ncbi:long-chain-fatty-acid--CoA ligase 5 [Trichonephila clavipes]|nr:long-chain-fatty-acid--CoA ligase 5 [Trichonephila clavipes]